MLKKLRLKFVLFTMAIVTVMLGIIFGLLYYSTANNLERESLQMMNSLVRNPMRLMRPDDLRGDDDVRLPYFSVIIDPEGHILELGGGYYDLSDTGLVQEILTVAEDTEQVSGVLDGYALRYLRSDGMFGEILVFADITSEQTTLQHLLRAYLLAGAGAFLVFLGISILLAHAAVKPVEKAWQQQKQFLADASHELKTPLTVIMTDAELLHASQCTEEERERFSGSILTMSGQMRGLVESMLELARMDNGSVRRNVTTLNASDLMLDAAMMFEPVFFDRELLFDYEVEPDLMLNGDGTHLKQLADILLDNAAKYASPGAQVQLNFARSGHKSCRLTVSNQGEAIPDSELKKLFKRFYRADRARAMNHSYGLGLAIAESIAAEHHGRIWAESKDGWNRFHAELPLKPQS